MEICTTDVKITTTIIYLFWKLIRYRHRSDDILRAVRSLKPLGSGFSIIVIGQQPMIRSIPKELNTDQSTVLEAIQVLGYVTVSMLQDNLEWESFRAQTVLEDLLSDALIWIDSQAEEPEYWAPMLMHDRSG